MLKFIILFCVFVIVYASLNLLYVLKKCYPNFQKNINKKRKNNKKNTKKITLNPLPIKQKSLNKILLKRLNGNVLLQKRARRIVYMRNRDVMKHSDNFDLPNLDEKMPYNTHQDIKIPYENALTDIFTDNIESNSLKVSAYHKSIDAQKKEINVDLKPQT